jgi:phosphatidylinositol alpha-1,6-mannosyltransferase
MSKITLITIDYPPQRGGVARYLAELVKTSQGEMEVIVPSVIPAKAGIQDEKNSSHGMDSRLRGNDKRIRWWTLVPLCLKQKGKTILVSHVFPVGTAAWISRLLGGPEYAVLFHGMDLRQVNGGIKKWILKQICQNAKALYMNSHSTRKDALKRIPQFRPMPVVITPGAESIAFLARQDARRKLAVDQDIPIVISIARLVPRKGIDMALRAMARIQKDRDVSYVVIGDGPDRERLLSIAEENKTHVTWIRDASDEEKWVWLAAADVFVLPVRDEGDDVEGFGIVFLEAALASIPSIAGNSGGASEAVLEGETGFLVDPHSVDEIAAGIEKVIWHEELRDQLGKRGRSRALHEFDWKDRWQTIKQDLT